MDDVNSLAQWTNSQFDPALSWKDVEWIKSIWPGKLILKGILDPEDAKTAVKLGADAIVVSNHGGRQLDGAPSSISALPAVADAVGADTEVLFDGGIRTGADAMRALALGARGCLIGRAYAFGLGAGGQAGVAKAIDILNKELSVTMALTGTNKIADIGRPRAGGRRGEEEAGAGSEDERQLDILRRRPIRRSFSRNRNPAVKNWSPLSLGRAALRQRQPSPGATCLRIASMTWAL